jgi:hypothetical protein
MLEIEGCEELVASLKRISKENRRSSSLKKKPELGGTKEYCLKRTHSEAPSILWGLGMNSGRGCEAKGLFAQTLGQEKRKVTEPSSRRRDDPCLKSRSPSSIC